MTTPIPKPGLRPKKPRKAIKRSATKKAPAQTGWYTSTAAPGHAQFVIKGKNFGPPIPDPPMATYTMESLLPKRTPLPKTNPERKRERHMRDFDGGIQHDHYVRAQGCALGRHHMACSGGPIQAAHVSARSIGGRWHSLVGLCNTHHRFQEQYGAAHVLNETGIDLAAIAKRNVLENLKEKGAI